MNITRLIAKTCPMYNIIDSATSGLFLVGVMIFKQNVLTNCNFFVR